MVLHRFVPKVTKLCCNNAIISDRVAEQTDLLGEAVPVEYQVMAFERVPGLRWV